MDEVPLRVLQNMHAMILDMQKAQGATAECLQAVNTNLERIANALEAPQTAPIELVAAQFEKIAELPEGMGAFTPTLAYIESLRYRLEQFITVNETYWDLVLYNVEEKVEADARFNTVLGLHQYCTHAFFNSWFSAKEPRLKEFAFQVSYFMNTDRVFFANVHLSEFPE